MTKKYGSGSENPVFNRHFKLFVRFCHADSHFKPYWSIFVRIHNADSYFEPYRSILPGVKQGDDMGKGIHRSIFPPYEKQAI